MTIRESKIADKNPLQALYLEVSQNRKGIARSPEEISDAYVLNILNCPTNGGLHLVGFEDGKMIAEIHAEKYGLGIFDHILSGLTIVVHPEYQGKGYGKKIFEHFLKVIESQRTDIYRVELESRSSNEKSIKLYESLGFQKEGLMLKKTRNFDGSFEDSVMFSWFNENFEKQSD